MNSKLKLNYIKRPLERRITVHVEEFTVHPVPRTRGRARAGAGGAANFAVRCAQLDGRAKLLPHVPEFLSLLVACPAGGRPSPNPRPAAADRMNACPL